MFMHISFVNGLQWIKLRYMRFIYKSNVTEGYKGFMC